MDYTEDELLLLIERHDEHEDYYLGQLARIRLGNKIINHTHDKESDPLSAANVKSYLDSDKVTGNWAMLSLDDMRSQVGKRALSDTLQLIRVIDYVRNEMRARLERLDVLETNLREIVRDSVTSADDDTPF